MEDHKMDPRHVARAIALQQLFNHFHGDPQAGAFSNDDLLDILEEEGYDNSLATALFNGVVDTHTQIDPIIQELAPAWPLAQIAPVDLTILRMSIWEAFLSQTNPARVVINEAIELAKEFGGPNSSSFVNGVLGTLLNKEDIQAKLTTDASNNLGAEQSEAVQ